MEHCTGFHRLSKPDSHHRRMDDRNTLCDQVANQLRVRGIAWRQPHNLAVRRIGYVGVICGQWHMNESECAIDLCPSLAHV